MEIAIDPVRDPLTLEDSSDGTSAQVLDKKSWPDKKVSGSLCEKNPGRPKIPSKVSLKKIPDPKNPRGSLSI